MALTSLLMCFTMVPPLAAWATTSPEQSIRVIEIVAEAAAGEFDSLSDQYHTFLESNPSSTEALTGLNQAVADVNRARDDAVAAIEAKMRQNPENQDVQDAGNAAIAAIWDTAASEIAAMTNSYNAYIAGATTTTTLPSVTTTTLPTVTTTTLPTVTTTLPKVTTTLLTTTTTAQGPTSTTLDGTSTTTTTITPQAVPEPAPPSTTTTTTPELVAAAPPLPPEPPLSTAALASRLGAMAAFTSAQPLTLTRVAEVVSEPGSTVGSVLELVRISLPAAVVDPIVDMFIILQAVAAAFVSGVLALAWPAAVLLLVLLVQAAMRWVPNRRLATGHRAIVESSGG